MSIKYMTAVWDMTGLKQSQTLVALALADHANDAGLCWPSIDRIAAKARLKRRQTQTIIRQLEQIGLVSVTPGTGRRHTNGYQFAAIKGAEFAPHADIAPCSLTTVKGAVAIAKKGAVAIAPESPRTSNEPPKGNSIAFSDIDGLEIVAWEGWLAYRRKLKLKPYASDMMARKLAALPHAAQRACIEASIENNWQGLFPDKFAVAGGKVNDPYHEQLRQGMEHAHD